MPHASGYPFDPFAIDRTLVALTDGEEDVL